MDYQKNLNLIYCPSYAFERRTKAFNKYIWWFVALVSAFTVSVGVTAFHACMSSVLGIVSSLIKDYLVVFCIVPVLIFVALTYQLVQMVGALLTTYKLENGCLVKGKIQRPDSVHLSDLVYQGITTVQMLDSGLDSDTVLAGNASFNWRQITKLIRLNMNKDFVAAYFDTDLYKKKIYYNPKLIKTTKYSLIFACDNKKKLVVPRIYEGLYAEQNRAESSFVGRIVKRSVLVFLIAFVAAVVDLAVGFSKNDAYVSDISATMETLEDNWNAFGYESKDVNEKVCRFVKEINGSDRTAEIKYYFDKHGNIKDVDFQLYYEAGSQNAAAELEYLIDTMEDDFDSEEVDEFIEAVTESLNGNPKHKKLQSDNYTLRMGTSGEYLDIHDY